MEVSKITITQEDKYRTVVYPHYANNPKGSVLILHGMAEHHDRYNEFARFLNDHGYDVYLYDHRGHGLDKKYEDLGMFAEKNGYKLVIRDAITVLRYVRQANRGEKLILFGHSMGSLIARNVIQYYDKIDGCIICGTANVKPFMSTMGSAYGWFVDKFHGPYSRNQSLANLITGGKRYQKVSNRTAFDWLTRDNSIVGAYIHDPYCGFLCTTSFYRDMLKFTYLSAVPKLIKRTRRDLPILIISGSDDPVGNFGKDVAKLFTQYQHYGFTKVDCTIYDECRHELLNELNHKEIMDDIYNWMENTDKLTKEQETSTHDAEPAVNVPIPDELTDEAAFVDKDSAETDSDGELRLAKIREEKKAEWVAKHGEDYEASIEREIRETNENSEVSDSGQDETYNSAGASNHGSGKRSSRFSESDLDDDGLEL